MADGYGRGRGWLNLKKNASPPKPLGLSQPPGMSQPLLFRNPSPPPAMSEHQELINRIGKISLEDDGMTFDQKMRFIEEYWSEHYSCQEEVEASFEDLYNACLHQAELGSKLVALVASQTFILQNVYGCNMRRHFLERLQNDLESSIRLQATNTLQFQNSVHMLGEFYNKEQSGSFLAPLLVSCMDLLLNGKNIPDLIVVTNQLFLNGSRLNTDVPEELANLEVKIRNIIVTEPQLVPKAKLWLLLALDSFNSQFGLLRAEVYRYYDSQLGSAALKHIQSPFDVLSSSSIQTNQTYKEVDSCQSNLNVLQISTPPTEAPQNEIEIQGSHYTNQFEDNDTQQNSFPKDGPKSEEQRR